MKHCSFCREEFEDWAETCPDCGSALEEGSPPPEDDGPESEDPSVPQPPDLEEWPVVWLGATGDGEKILPFLKLEGIPAALTPVHRDFEDETDPGAEIRVPPMLAGQAAWFFRGFERAFDFIDETPPPADGSGGCCS